MKLATHGFHGAHHVKRAPLRTLIEMAEMLGVSRQKLVRALQAPGAPKPELADESKTFYRKQMWFNVARMRDWWARRGVTV